MSNFERTREAILSLAEDDASLEEVVMLTLPIIATQLSIIADALTGEKPREWAEEMEKK